MKQQQGKRTFLITGGTGFIGSHIAVRLLSQGHFLLILARSQKQLSATERFFRLLDWFGVEKHQRSRIQVLEGQLDHPTLGLNAGEYISVLDRVDETIHCASDTSFSVLKREEVEKTNVEGLKNLLALVVRSRCRSFHLISTAYVAGAVNGLCKEDYVPTETFHNVYEETKARGEQIAMARCLEKGIKLGVYRPSIVCGDANTGRTLRFNALYYPVRTMHFFQKIYTRDILEQGGSKARSMGIHLDQAGTLHLPVRIESSESGGINLIPVNHFVESFISLLEDAPEGGVFHIVNPRNTEISHLIDYTQRFFRLKGIRIAASEEFRITSRNALEVLFENHVRAYSPYMKDTRVFENHRTENILSQRNIVCPEFNYDLFATCMQYALDVDWGRLLEPEITSS